MLPQTYDSFDAIAGSNELSSLGKSSLYGFEEMFFDGPVDTSRNSSTSTSTTTPSSYNSYNGNLMYEYPHPHPNVGPVARAREYVVDEHKQWGYTDPYYDHISYAQMARAYMNDSNYFHSYDNHQSMMIPMGGDLCPGCTNCGAKRRYLNYHNRPVMRDCGSHHYYNDSVLSMEKDSVVGKSRTVKENLSQVDRNSDVVNGNNNCSKSSPRQFIKDDLDTNEDFWSEDKKRKNSFRHRTNEDDAFLDKETITLKKLISKKRSPKSTWTKMTKEIFNEMVEFEKSHPHIKQCDLEKYFNVNRSTYWRWKRNFGIGKVNGNLTVATNSHS